MRHLAKHRGRVIDRDELVHGRAFVGSNVVDAAVRLLRKKLGAHADVIETVKGFGYRFRKCCALNEEPGPTAERAP